MDFSISDDDLALAQNFENFCQKEIAPRAAQVDQEEAFSRENFQALRDVGYLGLHHDENVGGQNATWLSRVMTEESLAKACASTFLSVGASIGLCGGPLAHFASESQKQKWLKPLVEGETIGCFALTEPHCGTDAARINTRAKKSKGQYLLRGEKALITNAPIADVALVFARTDEEAGVAGVTAFIVDLNKKGVGRSKALKKMGLRGSPTGSLHFDDVILSDDDVLGEVGQGFVQAMMTLEHGRIGMAHFGIGIAEAAYEASLKYANEREAFGRAISKKQAVHFKIANMKVDIDAARLMTRKVAWTKYEAAQECRELASIAKLFATEMAVRVSNDALQIHGGWGYTNDFVVERLCRDARLGPIGEGTSEIQKELIAKSLLASC